MRAAFAPTQGAAAAGGYVHSPARPVGRPHPTVPTSIQLTTRSPAETRQVGAVVAGILRPGDVVALTGELGAGKTCFVQGAAAALGVTERVTSPSFILRKDYRGTIDVMHLDVYRLDRLQDVLDLGYDEALDRRRVVFIEWGDAMAPLLPADHLEVELQLAPDPTAGDALDVDEPRHIRVTAHGPDWTRRLTSIEGDLLACTADGGTRRATPRRDVTGREQEA